MKRKRKEKVEIEVGKFNLRLFTDIVVKVSIHPPQINTDLQCATHEPKGNQTRQHVRMQLRASQFRPFLRRVFLPPFPGGVSDTSFSLTFLYLECAAYVEQSFCFFTVTVASSVHCLHCYIAVARATLAQRPT